MHFWTKSDSPIESLKNIIGKERRRRFTAREERSSGLRILLVRAEKKSVQNRIIASQLEVAKEIANYLP